MNNNRIEHEILEKCNPKKESYVSLCFDAITQLSENRYLITNTESDNEVILERNYILAMVFLMGKKTKDDESFGTNVFPSGENNKYICDNLNDIKETYNNLHSKELKGKFKVIPDLVIHTSHNPKSQYSKSQYVALEAKTTKQLGKVAFYRDLFKLNVYLCDLSYKDVVYLIVNTEKKKIEDLISQYFSNNYFYNKDKLNNIWFFIQENGESSPYAYKLCENYIKSL